MGVMIPDPEQNRGMGEGLLFFMIPLIILCMIVTYCK